MKRKSHYTILGVRKGESPDGIRAAYLRRVKALHPDHAGQSSTPAFREVQQAYDVLSDPVKRRSYDRQIGRRPDPPARHRGVEPLVPNEELTDRRRPGEWSRTDGAVGRVFPGLTPIEPALAGRRPVLDLEAALSPRQAVYGGDFELEVPVWSTCRVCGGTGAEPPFPCLACRGRGIVARRHVFHLRLPPGIRHGAVLRLRPEGPVGVEVRLRLVVDERMRAPPGR